jgi:hypothetical protein
MNVTTMVYLNPRIGLAVLRMLKARGDARSLPDLVEDTVQAWLQQCTCEDPPAAQAAARGYQWKSLFLPEGTLVRFTWRHDTYNAQVCGDAIVYRGRAYSPRALLLHVTGSVRNAWRELWLRSPGDDRWHLADTRRHILRRSARGLHRRGEDTVRPPPDKPIVFSTAHNMVDYDRKRSVLYRDDLVRPDQPDLTSRRGGGGRTRAGREGPRDRRYLPRYGASP